MRWALLLAFTLALAIGQTSAFACPSCPQGETVRVTDGYEGVHYSLELKGSDGSVQSFQAPSGSFKMIPGVGYTLTAVTTPGGGYCGGGLNDCWHIWFDVSGCHKIEIDGNPTNSIDDYAECVATRSWSVRLVDSDSDAAAGNSSGGIGSAWWSASLGPRLANGRSAGSLSMYFTEFAAGSYTKAALKPASGNPLVSEIGSASSGQWQFVTPEVVVDISDLSSPGQGIRVRFFYRDGLIAGPGGFFNVAGSSAFVTHTIRNPDHPSLGSPRRLLIEESRNSNTETMLFVHDSTSNEWSLSDSKLGMREAITRSFSGDDTTIITKRWQFLPSGGEELVAEERRLLRMMPWGSSETIEANVGRTNGQWNPPSTYVYYGQDASHPSAPAEKRYSKLKWVLDDDGAWEWYDYEAPGGQTDVGLPTKIRRPWMNSPAHPSAATDTNCVQVVRQYTNFSWAPGYVANMHLLEEEVRVLGNVQKKVRYAENWSDGSYWEDRYGEIQRVTVSDYLSPGTSAGAAVRSERRISPKVTSSAYGGWMPVSNLRLGGRPLQLIAADGTATSYSYEMGEFDAATKVFTPNPNPTTFPVEGSAVRITETEGTENALDGIANRTRQFMRIEDSTGQIVFEEHRVCLAPGSFETYATLEHKFDYLGRLVRTLRDGEEIYSVSYSADESEVVTVDEYGVQTTEVRNGLESTTTVDDGSVQSVSASLADTSGRTLEQTDAGLTTTYAYETLPTGEQKTITTHPGTATTFTEQFRDGQLAKSGGSASPQITYTYTVGSDGLTTIAETATSGNATRLTTSVRNMLGRSVSVARPSFGGGTTLTEYAYNTKGQLASSTVDVGLLVAPSATIYNDLGQPELTGLDMDGGGLSLNSATDRIRKNESFFAKENGKWFRVERSSQNLPDPYGLTVTGEVWSRLDGRKTIIKELGGRTRTSTTTIDRPARRMTIEESDSRISGTRTSVYAGSSTLLSVREPWQSTNQKTDYGYHPDGRLASVTNALNQATTYLYYPDGQLGAGQLATITAPNHTTTSFRTTTFTYTPRGEIATESGTGAYPKSYLYNLFGELTHLTTQGAAGPAATEWIRDPGTGLVERKLDADNMPVIYTFNAPGWLTTRRWARGVTTSYTHTRAGEVKSITYSDGTPGASSIAYDRAGRLTNATDAAGTMTGNYSVDGQRATETYGGNGILSGYRIDRTFEGTRRTGLGASLASSSVYPVVAYGDDAFGNLGSVQQLNVTASYTPQPGMSLPKEASVRASGQTPVVRQTGFDALGRVTRVEASVGGTVRSGFGSASNPITYDPAGRRTTIPKEDGTKWNYGYNARSEVISGVRTLPGDQPLAGHTFAYLFDAIGNRESTTANGRTAFYTPNNLNQYLSRTVPGYAHITGSAASQASVNINGQPATRQGIHFHREVAAANTQTPAFLQTQVSATLGADTATRTGYRFFARTPEVFDYDDDGNLRYDGRWNYTWDGENRLAVMETTPAAVAAGAPRQRLTFTYDMQSRRIAKRVERRWNGSAYQDAYTILFLYDGWNPIAEILAGGTVLRTYLWGTDLSGTQRGAGGIGGLLAIRQLPENRTYAPAYDTNGNVSLLLDVADPSGPPAAQYEYGPFGEPIAASGPYADINPIRWSTKYTDDESGLVYYGYRFYNPETGRWLNRDPIGERGGINLYAAVRNQNINLSDMLGLFVINTEVEGRDYYRSNRGGVVDAGDSLLQRIKNSGGFKASKATTIKDIKAQLLREEKRLCCKTSGVLKRTPAEPIGFHSGNNVVAHIDVYSAPYEVRWYRNAYDNRVYFFAERKLSFLDDYEFEFDIENPVVTFVSDVLPGIYADKGTPYKIRGRWNDKIDHQFTSFKCIFSNFLGFE